MQEKTGGHAPTGLDSKRCSPGKNQTSGRHRAQRNRPRRVGARTHGALEEAIGAGLETIPRQDAQGWFGHCGYPASAVPGQEAVYHGSIFLMTAVAPS